MAIYRKIMIVGVKNAGSEFEEVQEKLFANGAKWGDVNRNIVKEIKPHNGDDQLILLVNQDGLISWTNKKYGYRSFYDEEYERFEVDSFMKDDG